MSSPSHAGCVVSVQLTERETYLLHRRRIVRLDCAVENHYIDIFTDQFSGPGRESIQSDVCLCVLGWLAGWIYLDKLGQTVKVINQGSEHDWRTSTCNIHRKFGVGLVMDLVLRSVVDRLTDIQTGMLVALLAPLPGAGVRDWSSID